MLIRPDSIPSVEFPGSGDKIYFFHGNGFPPSVYRTLMEKLSPLSVTAPLARPLWKDFTCHPKKQYDWRPFVEDVIAFLEGEKARSIFAVGHSMGAILMLLAGAQRPDLFRKMVLLDPVLFSQPLSLAWWVVKELGLGYVHPFIARTLRRKAHFDSLEKLYRRFRKKKVFRRIDDPTLRCFVESIVQPSRQGGVELVYSPLWEAWIYAHDPHNVWQKVRRLPGPVLALRGEDSEVFTELSLSQFLQRYPKATGKIIPQSGHLLPLEAPKEVARSILDFYYS